MFMNTKRPGSYPGPRGLDRLVNGDRLLRGNDLGQLIPGGLIVTIAVTPDLCPASLAEELATDLDYDDQSPVVVRVLLVLGVNLGRQGGLPIDDDGEDGTVLFSQELAPVNVLEYLIGLGQV